MNARRISPPARCLALASVLVASLAPACAPSTPQAPAPAYPQPQPYTYPPAQQGYPQPYPQQPYPQPAPATPYTPAQPAPMPAPTTRPLLAPLVGPLAWQNEVRSVIAEDIAALAADNQARVRGIPLVFDPTLDVNAYASCEADGPRLTGTEGLLEAIDAIAQTRATDELFGTHTYDAYTSTVIPILVRIENASPALPPGIIPAQYYTDARRWSRAHEWFDELVAFTFGHELSHHYLGHTGCANGAPAPLGGLAQLAGALGHGFAQPLESFADSFGVGNMLDAGRARVPQYRWTEEGAFGLLDFFVRLERAIAPSPGQQVFVAFVGDHPPAAIRIGWVQAAVNLWHLQHPG